MTFLPAAFASVFVAVCALLALDRAGYPCLNPLARAALRYAAAYLAVVTLAGAVAAVFLGLTVVLTVSPAGRP